MTLRIFGSSECPPCDELTEKLDEKGVQYAYSDIEEMPEAYEDLKELGEAVVPVATINVDPATCKEVDGKWNEEKKLCVLTGRSHIEGFALGERE